MRIFRYIHMLLMLIMAHYTCGLLVGDAQNNKNLALMEELIAKHRETLKQNPEDGLVWALLAMILHARDDIVRDGGISHPEIFTAFQNAFQYQSEDTVSTQYTVTFWLNHNYAKFLAYVGKVDDAIERHSMAISAAKNNGERALGLFYRAATYYSINSLDEALVDYTKVLELYPNFYAAYLGLTQVMLEHPSIPKQNWRNLLASMERVASGNNSLAIEIMTDQAEKTMAAEFSVSIGDLYRAMYNVADRLKEYSYAFQLLEKANKMDDEIYPPFNHAESLQRSMAIIQIFREDKFIDILGHSSDVPVFIVGMMRSGSSILEHVLDAHSNIVGIGEDSIFNGLLPVVINDISNLMKQSKTIEAVAEVIQRHADTILSRMHERAEAIRKEQGRYDPNVPIRYIVDKMVFNFRNVGLIQLLFPHATVIHIIRDPMDTLFSCFSRKFEAPDLGWTRKMETLISEYVMYLHVMNHFDETYSGSITHVVFEKIAANPEKEFRKLIENSFGLPWEPDILKKNSRPRCVMTNSGIQIRRDIDFSGVGKWRRYARQLTFLLKNLKLALVGLKEADKLLFPDIINWELDPLFNYNEKYNVSVIEQGPRWAPNFEFQGGSGSRIAVSGSKLMEEKKTGLKNTPEHK